MPRRHSRIRFTIGNPGVEKAEHFTGVNTHQRTWEACPIVTTRCLAHKLIRGLSLRFISGLCMCRIKHSVFEGKPAAHACCCCPLRTFVEV